MEATPKQREFQDRVAALLAEYAAIVGPAFDGNAEEGNEAEMPVPTRWMMVTEWADVADPTNGPFTILTDSGVSWMERMGLVHSARHMVEDTS